MSPVSNACARYAGGEFAKICQADIAESAFFAAP